MYSCSPYSIGFVVILKQEDNPPRDLECLETDDTVYLWNKKFIELEEILNKLFGYKEMELFSPKNAVKFNESTARHGRNNIVISKR